MLAQASMRDPTSMNSHDAVDGIITMAVAATSGVRRRRLFTQLTPASALTDSKSSPPPRPVTTKSPAPPPVPSDHPDPSTKTPALRPPTKLRTTVASRTHAARPEISRRTKDSHSAHAARAAEYAYRS